MPACGERNKGARGALGANVCAVALPPVALPQVYEGGALYDTAILAISDDAMLGAVQTAISSVAALCLATGFPTLASIPHSVVNAYKNVLAIAIATDYTFPLAQKVRVRAGFLEGHSHHPKGWSLGARRHCAWARRHIPRRAQVKDFLADPSKFAAAAPAASAAAPAAAAAAPAKAEVKEESAEEVRRGRSCSCAVAGACGGRAQGRALIELACGGSWRPAPFAGHGLQPVRLNAPLPPRRRAPLQLPAAVPVEPHKHGGGPWVLPLLLHRHRGCLPIAVLAGVLRSCLPLCCLAFGGVPRCARLVRQRVSKLLAVHGRSSAGGMQAAGRMNREYDTNDRVASSRYSHASLLSKEERQMQKAAIAEMGHL